MPTRDAQGRAYQRKLKIEAGWAERQAEELVRAISENEVARNLAKPTEALHTPNHNYGVHVRVPYEVWALLGELSSYMETTRSHVVRATIMAAVRIMVSRANKLLTAQGQSPRFKMPELNVKN